jgi:hypothetical protein
MAQYLEQFNYTLTSSSLPYAINNGSPYFDGGLCFLPVNSFINKDFAGNSYEFQGQNYVGNYAISFDLVVEFLAEATFTILCYDGASLSPAIYANMMSSPYVQLCWTSYENVNYNTNSDALTLGDFNGTTVNESGTTYRVTYLKKLVEPGLSHVAMHVVSPNGTHYRSGWAVAYESDYHNQIGNNTTGDGEFAIGTISVQDDLSNEELNAILDAGEGGSARVATPTLSVSTGTYNNVVTSSASCETLDATIYYTANGDDPTTASSVFSGTITFGPSATPVVVKLLASNGVLPDSVIASFTYTFVCANPTASPPTGIFSTTVNVELSCSTIGASIYYTLDGSNPTTSSALYSNPIEVTSEDRVRIRYFASSTDYQDSSILESTYNYQITRVDNWENLDNWEVNQPSWLSLPGDNTLVVVYDNPILKLLEPIVDIFVVEVNITPNDDALIYFINADSTIDSTATEDFSQLWSADVQFGVMFEQGFGQYAQDIVLIWNDGSQQQIALVDYNSGASYRLLFGKIGTQLLLKVYDAGNTLIADVTKTLLVSNNEVKLLVGAGKTETVWNPMTFRYRLSEEEAEDIIDSGAITEHVLTPVVLPASGNYTEDVLVSITCDTPDVNIRYTLDGSEPTLSSTLYGGPFNVGPQPLPIGTTSTETVLGATTPTVIMADGRQWTAANAFYTTESIGKFWNNAETDDGFGGYYNRLDIIALQLSGVLGDGWRIPDYTTDVVPLKTALDLQYAYQGGLGLTNPAGFNALYAGFLEPSETWSSRGGRGYFIASGPTDGWATLYYYGCINSDTELYVQTVDEGALGLAGVNAVAMSLRLVRDATLLSNSATVRARAFHATSAPSDIVEVNYTFSEMPQVATPMITPDSGTYEVETLIVTIACATVDASIYYTVDGTTPTAASNLYAEPLELTAPFYNTVSAVAVLGGYLDSSVASQAYILIEPLPPPVFTPPSGTYADTVIVSMSAEGGASIWYHIEGTPETDWFVYITPLTITETTTIAARAEIGSRNSLYAYATYSISLYQKKNSVLLYDFAFGIST